MARQEGGALMGAVHDCPACGRGFIKGRKALVPMRDGRLVRRMVCIACGSKAERVITRITAQPCVESMCPNPGRVCHEHHRAQVNDAHRLAVLVAAESVRAVLAGLKLVQSAPDEAEFVQGKIEGLEGALHVLTKART
jgi:hypothetical protein